MALCLFHLKVVTNPPPLTPLLRRQALLAARGPAERLRALLKLLNQMGRVRCGVCGAAVAEARRAVALTEEGAGGAFVNAHG